MFSFLNRTKNHQPPAPPPSSGTTDTTSTNGSVVSASVSGTSVASSTLNGSKTSGVEINGNGEAEKIHSAQIEAHLNEIKKNLLEAILLKRTDIVVSLINEWFKEHKNSSDDGLKYFFNTNYCENNTSSPLLVAYSLKEKDIVRTLLNFGADPSLKENKNNKCLIDMIREPDADPSMVQLVSDCFMQAIVQGNLNVLKQYLRGGFDVNPQSHEGARFSLPDANSYLHWAVMYANESVVRLLIENGAQVNSVNKQGATPLHEAILRKATKEEQMRIIETLLVHKADPVHIKGTNYEQNALELAASHADPDVFALIRDFVADLSSMASSSSVPTSPLPKSPTPTNTLAKNDSSSSLSPNSTSKTTTGDSSSQLGADHMNSWMQSQATLSADPSANDLKSLLWPRPQIVTLLGDPTNNSEKFYLSNVKHQPLYIYFRPPHTYAYMDVVNKLASAFSGLVFYCIHKPVDEPHICVSIDESAFRRHDEYSILVTNKKILISAANSVALQYAFFTFMQLCKIYARHAIPALRIIDYSDVKYRSVLFDFSQGFYFKYENLLAVLQMLAFYKINQVHFYVKFSSLPPASLKKQWYHYIHNWFGLMKFCEEVNIQIVPSIDISNDVAELLDVLAPIKEYLDLFKGASKFINIGPRLSSLLTCMENKNPFGLDSSQSMMLCSYLFHNGDAETNAELDKFDRYVLMEYGLKSGADFASKAINLYKSGLQYFYCIGNSNWNSLLGCPDGFLHNLYDAVDRQPLDQPIGLLLCNFIGSLNKNPFAFNLNSMVMFAGASWNCSITMNEIKKNIPLVLLSHGLINDKDGELGIVMFELGHLETFLTRKSVNAKNFLDLPYDEGSIFVRLLNTPDEVDLDALDKHIFRKSLFHLRAQQSKLKSLLTGHVSVLFKEVSISAEIAFHLFKFLITLYNTGTRHQTANKAVGLNVINIGVANLTQTVRTDLANKLLILKEEYKQVLEQIYFKESVEDHMENFYSRLIDQLLADQVDSNMIELASIKSRQQKAKEQQNQKLMRSVSTSSSQSAYFVDYSNDESNHHLLLKK